MSAKKTMKETQAKLSGYKGLKVLTSKVANNKRNVEQAEESSNVDFYRKLPITEVISKDQVRKKFKGIRELADTIQQGGLEQPIHVLPKNENGMYVIAKGERRFRALKLLNWEYVPAIIQDDYKDNASRIVSQLVENIQRDNLPPGATGEALLELKKEGINGKEIAKRIGMSEAFVSGHISFLERSPDYIIELADNEIIVDIDALNFFRKLHDIAPERAKLLAEKAETQGEMSRGEVKKVFNSVKEEINNKKTVSEGSDSEEQLGLRDIKSDSVNTESTNLNENEEYSQVQTISIEGAELGEQSEGDSKATNNEESDFESDSHFNDEECIPGSGLITRVKVVTSGRHQAGALLLGLSESTTDHVWVKLDGQDVPERFKVSQIKIVAIERMEVGVEQM